MNTTRIIQELRQGNLVVTPTDTIYGILADATNIAAVRKVKIAKHRNTDKPLLLLVDSLDMLYAHTGALSPLEQEIIENYLPGKLTILLPKNSKVSNHITGESSLVGIRIPKHSEIIGIIREVGHPLASTSANLAGEPPITNISQLSSELLQHISYVEDAGTINSEPSSLIKVKDNKVVILRSGTVASQILKRYN